MVGKLELELLGLFSKGVLSGTQVQAIAGAAWADGWGWQDGSVASRLRDSTRFDDIVAVCSFAHGMNTWGTSPSAKALCQAGACGKFRANVQRDLFRMAEAHGVVDELPQPYKMNAVGPQGTSRVHHVYLPHETLGHYKTVGNDMTFSRDELDASPLGRLVTEWCQHADVAVPVADAGSVIPVGLHGDGVQYTTTMRAGGAKSIVAISFNVLAGSLDFKKKRFMISVISKESLCDCGCEGFHTLQDIFAVVAWSFQHMRGHAAPRARHDGTPWTAHDVKHRSSSRRAPLAAVIQVRGDWDWMSQAYRFRRPGQDLRAKLAAPAPHPPFLPPPPPSPTPPLSLRLQLLIILPPLLPLLLLLPPPRNASAGCVTSQRRPTELSFVEMLLIART